MPPSLALAGSIFGFLRFNTYPAELFMGDTGSQFLGFSAVSLSLSLTQGQTALSPLLPLMILGFPVLDTLAVMAQRITEGRPLFSPDKNHFHHKLIGLGFYHSESVLFIYIVQALLITAAFFFRFSSEWFLLAGYLALSAVILAGFNIAESRHWKLQRYHFFDGLIKGRLARLRERGILIKVCFRTVLFGVPLLLVRHLPRPFRDPPCLCSYLRRFPCDSAANMEVQEGVDEGMAHGDPLSLHTVRRLFEHGKGERRRLRSSTPSIICHTSFLSSLSSLR